VPDEQEQVVFNNQGQAPAGSVVGTAKLEGRGFTVYRGGNTYSFVIDNNETHGVIDVAGALDWLTAKNYIASSSYMTQFNFGWEICSTDGKADTFTVNGLTLEQGFK
jgi:Glycosyl hydrolase family 12